MTMIQYARASAGDLMGSVANNLAVGMLITAYDADSLIGRLVSESDWRKCGDLQQQWSDLVLWALRQNREKIVNLGGWDDLKLAREVLDNYIGSLCSHRSRLIRYIIEQAAVNYTHAMLRVSQAMGFNSLNWPDAKQVGRRVVKMMAQEIEGWWPVVGIRLDYLVQGHGKMLRRHLRAATKAKKKKNKVERDYFKTVVAQPLPARKKSATESDNLTGDEPCDIEPDEDEEEDEIPGW